jgi:hypothetical protein
MVSPEFHTRITMENLKTKLGRFSRYYNIIALICFNSLLLFVVINLIADAGLHIKEDSEKRAAMKGTPWAYKEFNQALAAVHPGKTKEQINRLIFETRHLTQGYDAFSQFTEVPCKGQYVNVDSRGFRPIADQKPWPPRNGDYIVFVFGGSTSFGYGVPDGLTIASYLQKLLTSNYGVSASVYNFGRGSYFSVQERVLFEKLLLKGYVPRMAIFVDGLNDFTMFDGSPAYTPDLKKFMEEGDVPTTRKVIRALPVVKVAKLLFSSAEEDKIPRYEIFKKASPNRQSALLQGVIERYKTNMRITEAISKEFGIIPVFVWQPVPVYNYDSRYNIFGRFHYNSVLPAVKPGYDLMAKILKSHTLGPNFIWAADIQENLKRPLYVDAVHYSGDMCKTLAKYVLKTMSVRKLDTKLIARTPTRKAGIVSKVSNYGK